MSEPKPVTEEELRTAIAEGRATDVLDAMRVTLQPGEVLLLRPRDVGSALHPEQCQELMDWLQEAFFPDNVVVVLPEPFEVSVIQMSAEGTRG